ncbi:MAG: hypothetical protein AB1497_06505 [Bacillota bacterium]
MRKLLDAGMINCLVYREWFVYHTYYGYDAATPGMGRISAFVYVFARVSDTKSLSTAISVLSLPGCLQGAK